MRTKPEYADFYRWEQFNKWADANGVGTEQEDWERNWNCWIIAIASYKKAAVNESAK